MLEIKNLVVRYKDTIALNGVDLFINEGDSLGIVGESGSGKTTLCKTIAGLNKSFTGEIKWKRRYKIQFIFQDSYSSINPRMNVFDIVTEPLQILNYKKEKIEELFENTISEVGLTTDVRNKYPHQLSGGQRQRITIARALISKPEIVICDEPISGLDISLAAQILNLIYDLHNKHRFSLIFVSHDISSVYYLTKRMIVLLNGFVIEEGLTEDIIENPLHPYTKLLVSSVLLLEEKDFKKVLKEMKKCSSKSKCPFYLRCHLVSNKCDEWRNIFFDKNGHKVKCVRFNLVENEKIPN